MRIPPALAQTWNDEPGWLADLHELTAACAETWNLELEEPIDTPHALVVPAGDAVLKLNAPSHVEADHEADALERWAGAGAARLLARDDERRALLIERCRPGTRLWDTDVEPTAVVAGLLPRLSGDPGDQHRFRLLAGEAERWLDEVPARYERDGKPFERLLLDFALDVFRTVDKRAAFLANQDFHGGNILRSSREPWLVIDPKPLVGERELSAVGLLRNAVFRDADATRSLGLWLDVLSGLGLDRERVRGWSVAHALAWGWDDTHGWSREAVAVARAIAAT